MYHEAKLLGVGGVEDCFDYLAELGWHRVADLVFVLLFVMCFEMLLL